MKLLKYPKNSVSDHRAQLLFKYKNVLITATIIFLACQCYTSEAQQQDSVAKSHVGVVTTVTGVIIDSVSHHPLRYVSIGFTGSSYGTSSDAGGKFSLTAPGLFSTASISYLGYQSLVLPVRAGAVNHLRVLLKPTPDQLKEVRIAAFKNPRYRNKGNPAVELIRQVIAHKEENRMQRADYLQYDEYERVSFSLFHLSQKFINGRFFSKYRFMLDTSQEIAGKKQTTLPVFFSEKRYRYDYRRDPKKTIRVLQAKKEINIIKFIDTAGLDIYLNQLYGNNIDIYENNIFIITNQFLSPIAEHAPDFYKFFITDTLKTPDGPRIKLSFTPRNKGDLLFEGSLEVTADGRYAVTACDLEVNREININFMRSLQILQDFKKYPDGRFYLNKSQVNADFGISKKKGTGVYGQRTVFYENYKLNSPEPATFYNGKEEQVSAGANQTDTSYWSHHRTDTLPLQQAEIYAKINKLEGMPSFRRASNFASTITGGYVDLGPFQAGPYGATYSFNPLEGTRIRVGGRTTPEFSPSVYFEGYGAYGTKDERFKYYVSTSFAFNQLPYYKYPNNFLRVSYQNDTDIPGQNFLIAKSQSVLLSIDRGTNDLWLYNKKFAVDYVRDLEGHFSFDVGFKNWKQQPADELYFLPNDRQGEINEVTTSEFELGLRYAPHEQILQGTMYRRSLPSKYPIYSLQLNEGISGFLGSEYRYTSVNASISKRFYLSQLGYTDVTLLGGGLLGKVPFPLLNILPANQTYLYDPDEYNMMNFLEFVSDHYVGLNLTHAFNGFLLNKVPLIDHLKLREFASLKILYGGLRNENNPTLSSGLYNFPLPDGILSTYGLGNTPYIEAGFGVGNIFRFIRIDLIHRFNYLDHPGVTPYGLRFSFNPEL